ncbi:hypothetical protein [Microcoleus sp. Pol11C2]|uniref:hypothetical protein n=1 Tax=Microcoleus sp. Pol11C2 TaxID=3055389 RepID=UPI002FD07E4C
MLTRQKLPQSQQTSCLPQIQWQQPHSLQPRLHPTVAPIPLVKNENELPLQQCSDRALDFYD